MPSMMEIYERHSHEYDELVSAEDKDGSLPQALHSLADWQDRLVYEAGVGTGRVTSLYVEACRSALCYDRSEHMLQQAAVNLRPYRHKLSFRVADNLALPRPDKLCDLFVEGWSFGHVASEAGDVSAVTGKLVGLAEATIQSDGTLLFIETLGTNVDAPNPPHENLAAFYELLEGKHGFARTEVATDYQFETAAEAQRITGFFFGKEMADAVGERGSAVVPEWTGIWSRTG